MESLIVPTEEELINIQQQLQEIQQKQEEVKQLEKLQKSLTSFIDQEIIKLITYFSQYMKSKDVNLSKLMTLDTDQIVTGYKQFTQSIQADQFIKINGIDDQILLANGGTTNVGDFLPKHYPHAMEQMIIEPDNDIRNQGLRIMKNKANWDSFVLTGCNNDPTNSDGVWKMGSTSSQFRIQKQEDQAYDYKGLIIDFDCTSLKFNNQLVAPLPTPPIEYATYQSIAYGMYERLIWGTLTSQNNRVYISLQVTHSDPNTLTESGYTMFSIINNDIKPKFTGTQHNIPINAVMFAQKVIGYPICWNGAIPIDCFINPNGNVIINTQCKLHLPDDFCVQFCDSYAIYNQSS